MGPKPANNVLSRAWGGLVDFWSQFTAGPGYKQTKIPKVHLHLNNKLPKGVKLVINKPTKTEEKLDYLFRA